MADVTKEIGHGNISQFPRSEFFNDAEVVPELQPPLDIAVFNKMRNDAQIAGLLLAVTMPIRRWSWSIDPNGARDEVTQFVADNLNLPVLGGDADQPKKRSKGRFNHDRHLYQALLSLVYGFSYFEQVYRYAGADSSGRVPRGTDPGRLLLRKLSPRMPLTIQKIEVEVDGGLKYIQQWPSGRPDAAYSGVVPFYSLGGPIIEVDRLVAYVHDQEGGNWRGRPIIRSVYREWLIKDKMLRVNAIHHDRNGAGVPIAYAGPNTTPAEMGILSALAQSYRAGQASGGALPFGADLKLKGVEGSVPDTTGYIRYLDEKIAIAFQGQFMSLGSTASGSRALGETFYDAFTLLQETIANEYMATTNEHVIEDLVDLNFGESEQAPLLAWRRDDSTSATVADLVSLVGTGLLTVSPEMEDWIRTKYKLPEAPDVDLDDPAIDPALPPPAKVTEVVASKKAPIRTPALHVKHPQRALAAEGTAPDFGNREPTEVEQQAGVDFEKIYDTFEVALAALVARWMLVAKPAVTSDLAEQIENIFAEAFIRTGSAATDATLELDLASLAAEPIGADVIEAALVTYAATAMAQAIDEARYQGVDLGPPDTTHLEIVLGGVSAALAVVMAKSASEAASRAALARVGTGLSAAAVALEVKGALDELTDTYPRDILAGALSRAQFNARRSVFEQAEALKIASSEISDPAECFPCKEIDGKEYASWDEAAQDYPQGFFRLCLGRSRCRGIVICVLETDDNL